MTCLQCTSALFATIVLHAHLRQQTDIVVLSLLVTVFSVWFHSSGSRVVVVADVFFAHLYFAYTAAVLLCQRSPVLILSLSLAWTYAKVCREKANAKIWHLWMHVQVIVGSHIYIATTTPTSHTA